MTTKKARKMLRVAIHLGVAEMKVHLSKAVQTARSGETKEHNFLKISFKYDSKIWSMVYASLKILLNIV